MNGPGKVYQLDDRGRILGSVDLPATPYGIDVQRDGLVLAMPGRGLLKIDLEGTYRPLVESEISRALDVAIHAETGELIVADNQADNLWQVSANPEVKPRRIQSFKGAEGHMQSMSIDVTADNHLLFASTNPKGVFRLALTQDAPLGKAIIDEAGGVAADKASTRWAAATQAGLHVFDKDKQIAEIPFPPDQPGYRSGIVASTNGVFVTALGSGPRPELVEIDPESKNMRSFFAWGRERLVDFAVGPRLPWSGKQTSTDVANAAGDELSFVSFDPPLPHEFKTGERLNVSFAVQDPQTIPRDAARMQRGVSSLEELNNPKSHPAFTLVVDRRAKPLVSIELLDANGNVIQFDEEQTGLRSEGHVSGPHSEGERLVWMIRKTLTPPTSIRVKWYEKAELIQVPVDIDTYLGLGKAPPEKPVELAGPTSRLAGVVDGKPFHPDVVEYKNHSLVFRKFDDQISFSLFFWRELLKDGAQLRGGEGGSGGPGWIVVENAGDTDHIRENFTLALDITRYSELHVEGTLDLKIEGRDVHLSGPFSVVREKKPTDPLDKSDAPFVTGRTRVVGRTGGSTVGANFVGMGIKGNRLRGYSQYLQHGSSAVWTDQNAPQVSSIREDGDDHVIFQHAKVEPGDYLFSLNVGGSELNSSRPMAWVRRTVSDGDQIHVELDADLTKLGSVEVTIPESVVEAFHTRYDL